ncbi:hypothetical protein [Mucilaginibacter sp. SP1R1]|nr:hypothetical protein [Mucilaginibacter sp. SP1R1]MBB6147667.1 hypothetical protein [Mucilaginibacter sp. SP1R1]
MSDFKEHTLFKINLITGDNVIKGKGKLKTLWDGLYESLKA